MNLVGKMLTVFIFVLSVIFLAFSMVIYATHRNWKQVALEPGTGLKARVQSAQDALQAKEAEREFVLKQLDAERVARRTVVASLYSKSQARAAELAEAEKQLAELQSAHRVALATLQSDIFALDKLTVEVADLKKNISEAYAARDATFAEIVDKTDKLNGAMGMVAQLNELQNALQDRVARLKQALEANGLTEADARPGPADVDGYIVSVGNRGRVEVSLGTDDGLKRGHSLEVFRANTYVGRIRIVQTDVDRAVGQIDQDFRNGIVRVGDRVATNIAKL